VNDISNIKDAYGTLKQIIPLILNNQGTPNISGLLADETSRIDSVITGGYKIRGMLPRRFNFPGAGIPAGQVPDQPTGRNAGGCLIISTGPGEYIVAGRNMSLSFAVADPESKQKVSFLSLEDGRFEEGEWVTGRRLNGDEFRVSFPAEKSKIFKVSLYKY
jgi:hypothetical protein